MATPPFTVAGAVRNTATHTSSLTGVDPRTVCHFVCPVPVYVTPVDGMTRCARYTPSRTMVG
jgi:hypothetical protein